MKRYPAVIVWILLGIVVGVTFVTPSSDAGSLPSVEQILQELDLSAADQERIRQGKIVKWSVSEGSDRELAIGMAFLVKTKPPKLLEMFHDATAFKNVPVVTAYGRISDEGTLKDFARVKLEPNGEKEARRYLEVEPGEELNLDAQEMAAFHSLDSAEKNGAQLVEAVEAQIRLLLLSRYQAYRKKGLAGITPYERQHGALLLASDELSLALKELKLLAKHAPSLYNALLHYPNGKLQGGEQRDEQFVWLNIDVFGRPMYVLSHRTLFKIGEIYLAADRHFYTSHDYNSMVQGTVALPTKDGLLMIYLGRVSTDQVAGFASAVLHPASRAIASPYIKGMFETVREQVEKKNH